MAFRVLLPFSCLALFFLVFVRVFRFVIRILFPPTAEELRRKALGLLNRKNDDPKRREKAKKILEQSIVCDSQHLPSYLALASIQVYQEKHPKEGLETLNQAMRHFPKDEELTAIQLDAKAMQGNMGHMVLTGNFYCPHLDDTGLRLRSKR